MKKKPSLVVLSIAALVFLYSCTKDKTLKPATVDCSAINPLVNTWSNNINPNIVGLYCAYAGCHVGGASGGGIDMSTYTSSVNAFTHSTVICAITNGGCELMPKNSAALPDSLIRQMECWEANGFPQ